MIKNNLINVIFGLSLLLVFVAGLISYVGLYSVEGPFIIHFNYLGIADFIGGSENSTNVIIIALIIVGINFLLAYHLYERRPILSYALSFSSLVVSAFTLVASYLISSIN